MKCSSGVASCARIRSARIPPAPKKPKAVRMYMIPIRLWSTVVSQLVTRPVVHGTGRTAGSALTAKGLLLLSAHLRRARRALDVGARACRARAEGPVDVVVQRAHLAVVPRLADRRHRAAALAHDELQALPVVQQRVPLQPRADVALGAHAVALGADALEGLL